MTSYTNKLINETSPYLLQHAHNPVQWYPWGEEALQRAKDEDKPILVSIGYSACHWCHVMERESFEDETTARIMNENFINIKVDREERPDLDQVFMEAVQAISGSGGWPLNVFLTQDANPFFGGTYFPPKRAFNRPSWQKVLLSVSHAYQQKRNEIDLQASNLVEHLKKAAAFDLYEHNSGDDFFRKDNLDQINENILSLSDKEWGGFGNSPKFPQSYTILYLLRYHYVTGNKEALNQASLSLDKMIQGGIYDQIGGGFARYSTDEKWLVPHFEKMLYDNALMIEVLSEAFHLTGKKRYKEVIEETLQFIKRELYFEEGGFCSALDADSEGEEGKFYVWNYSEVEKILGKDFEVFCKYYGLTQRGNWEGKNILHVKTPLRQFSSENNIPVETLNQLLKSCREKLLFERAKRPRPTTDDKIILGWNALMNIACCRAFEATGIKGYRELAVSNMNFMLQKFATEEKNVLCHTWKNKIAKFPAFIDDYAYLIRALIQLHRITANPDWLIRAKELTEFVVENFSMDGTKLFCYTKLSQADILVKKIEINDGAIPSGNSVMAYNLYHLSILFDRAEWKSRSLEMVAASGKVILNYPVSFGLWACLFQEIVEGTNEIVITGKDYLEQHSQLLKYYIPHSIIITQGGAGYDFPLLSGKPVTNGTLLYLCRDFSCLPPVKTPIELISLINSPLR